jgi:hypothetical protein
MRVSIQTNAGDENNGHKSNQFMHAWKFGSILKAKPYFSISGGVSTMEISHKSRLYYANYAKVDGGSYPPFPGRRRRRCGALPQSLDNERTGIPWGYAHFSGKLKISCHSYNFYANFFILSKRLIGPP